MTEEVDITQDTGGEDRRARTARNLTYLLGVLVLAGSLVFGYSQFAARRRLEVLVNNQYYHSFFDLVGNVDNVRVALSKSLASGSPRLRVGALSDVWREASNAQANLNNLPVSNRVLMQASNFLTQVGDFAFVTARKLADQRAMTQQDWERLAEMKEQSEELAVSLGKMEEEAAAGRVRWLEVARRANAQAREDGNRQAGDAINDGFANVDEQVQHFPTLIYDGPFSDHVEQREPVGVTGSPITGEQAKEVARRFVPFDASRHTATVEEDVRGRIPAYRIRLDAPRGSNAPDAVVDVSKTGGHVVLMTVARDVGNKKLDLKTAVTRANEFLAQRGKPAMSPTYASEVGGVAVIPFVYTQDIPQGKVLVYPDLVKVKVGLDTGDIMAYEALGYLMSHRDRRLPRPEITAEEARELLSPALEVQGPARLAVIPVETVDPNEVFCWEFRATAFGEDFVVYINAETGQEEKVLQIISTPEGSLTM
ncbi:MAG: germination protein YpeB [Firmicutes bacterium]|jgi:germination protein YpeB|nr:germination protein YpeB [Bacillota bacterium]